MTAHRDFHTGGGGEPYALAYARLTRGDTTVCLTHSEFRHLCDCFGAHGFQPDIENCGLCRTLAGRLGFFDD